ncbi:hypothetical protein ABZ297_06975 [Nonomuraea sp. NPDC005983]
MLDGVLSFIAVCAVRGEGKVNEADMQVSACPENSWPAGELRVMM